MQIIANARASLAAMLPRGGIGAEIGVFRGGYSTILLEHARPKRLILVDPWRNSDNPEHETAWYGAGSPTDMEQAYQGVLKKFAPQIERGQVEVARAGSADWLAAQPDASLDFVYIDGDHSYAAVARDLELSCAKVRPNGMIGLDDYALGSWWKDGVVRAVHEALLRHRLLLHFVSDRQVLLRRLPDQG